MTDDEQGTQAFPETADIETSSDDYATRFSGAAGQWMLRVQENITLSLLRGAPRSPILDVGGGHGQLAIPLCREGFPVTVLGSAESCRTRIAGIVESGQCTFETGNVIDLPFPDNAFDTVISFRMLTHCSRWPELVAELCRVARQSVIVDYPTRQSINAIAPLLFGAKKKLEGNTRTWTLFRHQDVWQEFEKNGFALRRRKAQFFLPMVLHRVLRCRPISSTLEGMCRAVGLTRLWGSPVIIQVTRNSP